MHCPSWDDAFVSITVLFNISISVFISFASNHFYIYFIIVLSNTVILVFCVSFLYMNIESKTIWFCLMWLSTNLAGSQTVPQMSQHNTVCVVRLASTRYANPESHSIFLFSLWHIRISNVLFMWLIAVPWCIVSNPQTAKILSTYAWDAIAYRQQILDRRS